MADTSENPFQNRQWEIFLKIAIGLILLDVIISFGVMAYEWLYKDIMTIRFDSFIMPFCIIGLWHYSIGWRKFTVFYYSLYAGVLLLILCILPFIRFIPNATCNIHGWKAICWVCLLFILYAAIGFFMHHPRTRKLFEMHAKQYPPLPQEPSTEILPEVPIPLDTAPQQKANN